MKDDSVYIKHIPEYIDRIEKSIEGMSKSEFISDKDIQDSTLRRIEVIGEAAKQISEKFRNAHATVEWKKIAGTRDILIHAYFSVDIDLVWDIIRDDLPKLKEKLSVILRE